MKILNNYNNTRKRVRLHHRVISFLMVWVLLLTMMPYKSAGADDSVDLNGVGIYNNILTDQSGVTAEYKIELYKLKQEPENPPEGIIPDYSYEKITVLPAEYSLRDSNNSIVYLNPDGSLELEQGRTLKLFDENNSPFKTLLINNRIARIVITPQLEENIDGTQVKVLEQYPTVDGYSGSKSAVDLDTSNPPTGDPAEDSIITSKSKVYLLDYVVNANTGAVSINEVPDNPYKLKQFDLTPMVDLDVYVQWRDTNNARPAAEDVSFDISRAERTDPNTDPTDYSPYPPLPEDPEAQPETLGRTIITQDSNNIKYTFSVPEKSENGNAFVYKAEEHLPDGAKYSTSAVDNTHFVNYSLRDFTVKVNWLDSAHADEITKNIDLNFIKEHFELIDETEPDRIVEIKLSYTPEEYQALTDEQKAYVSRAYTAVKEGDTILRYDIPMTYEDNDGDGKMELTFQNLFEITSDGSARTYSIRQKVPSGSSEASPIPVSEVGSLTPGYDSTKGDDAYMVYAVNTGVRSNIVDRAYHGSEMNLLLTGSDTFEGPLEWYDVDNATARPGIVSSGNAGDFVLYRYVKDPNASSSELLSMVSQVGTWKIKDVEYTEDGVTKHKYIYEYKDSKGNTKYNIDKYDNEGREYFYFAKERLNAATLPGYTAQYVFGAEDNAPFGGQTSVTFNQGAVFPNHALVKNSLTGSIAYSIDANWIAAELQGGTAEIKYQLQNFVNGEWVNVEPIVHPADPTAGTDAFTEGLLDMDGFSAEMMEKIETFVLEQVH